MLSLFKSFLTRLGAVLPQKAHVQARAVVSYLELGRWLKDHNYTVSHRLPRREDVWMEILKVVADRKVLYLEFGVWEGRATRFWSAHLKNPGSLLHGFDSFEGLPHAGAIWSKAQFDVSGNVPQIKDDRVRFFKGWFDRTLPGYAPPEHEVLVLNMDADLYSSTECVFNYIGPFIRPGTFIYFDEMNFVEHEPKAFAEFAKKSGHQFRVVAADTTLAHMAFECVS
jgi:hypothetical protein